MKGTMSEMQLSLLRQRSLEALRQKACRGELFFSVAVGYVKVRRDRIAKDPDQRVQETIALVFRKFAEFQSMRQVHLWLRQEEILLPAAAWNDEGRQIVWKLPVYNSVRAILTNPMYAGAHACGRTESRKRILRAVLEEIVVTLADGRIEFLLHWPGGDHTRLSVRRNRTGQHRWSTVVEVIDMKSVHEVGQQANPDLAKGQIVGGSWIGIGQALYETTAPGYPAIDLAPVDFRGAPPARAVASPEVVLRALDKKRAQAGG